jgi:hypothetical protein
MRVSLGKLQYVKTHTTVIVVDYCASIVNCTVAEDPLIPV